MIKKAGLFCILASMFILISYRAFAEEGQFRVQYFPGDKFKFVERSNLRRYENGKFIGLSYREVRGILQVEEGKTTGLFYRAGELERHSKDKNRVESIEYPSVSMVHGNFYVFEETKHNNVHVAKKINNTVPVSFAISKKGIIFAKKPQPFPPVQGFPVFPERKLRPGDVWRAFGVRVVDPMRDNKYTHVKFFCEYRYKGKQIKKGTEYDVITAQYAMRYRQGDDPFGDERIERITGKHAVTLYYDSSGEKMSFMSDKMEENYKLCGSCEKNASVAFKGFILTWFDSIAVMNRTKLAEDIAKTVKEKNIKNVRVETRKEGVALTLNKIHFIANKAVILPEEKPRLKVLAEALKSIKGRSFLVVGHTARIGTEESQYKLSVERAKKIVDYLISRGIKPERLLYEGRGGTEPVAPNDTEENMAKNRRVEIIILED
ncbi:MAG: OmpA family protein [Spirochaetales bacterium]|nr:OmpA family protein [Spirochaetales bacterium]